MTYMAQRNIDITEACYVGNYGQVERILTVSPDQVNTQNKMNGLTPLHWAVKGGHVEIVKLLLAHGADPTVTDSTGAPPYALSNNVEIRELFNVQEDEVERKDVVDSEDTVSSSLNGIKPMLDATYTPAYDSYSEQRSIGNISQQKQASFNGGNIQRRDQRDVITQTNEIKPQMSINEVVNVSKQNSQAQRGITQVLSENDYVVIRAKHLSSKYYIEFPLYHPSIAELRENLEREFNLPSRYKILKMPDTIIRNDWDVSRFRDNVELCLITDE